MCCATDRRPAPARRVTSSRPRPRRSPMGSTGVRFDADEWTWCCTLCPLQSCWFGGCVGKVAAGRQVAMAGVAGRRGRVAIVVAAEKEGPKISWWLLGPLGNSGGRVGI